MSTKQAAQLGAALIAWSEGKSVEVRDVLSENKQWCPFDPASYEKIKVTEGIEWKIV